MTIDVTLSQEPLHSPPANSPIIHHCLLSLWMRSYLLECSRSVESQVRFLAGSHSSLSGVHLSGCSLRHGLPCLAEQLFHCGTPVCAAFSGVDTPSHGGRLSMAVLHAPVHLGLCGFPWMRSGCDESGSSNSCTFSVQDSEVWSVGFLPRLESFQ